ncbi:MAG: hypothetical protein ACXWPS_04355 [Ktedonobacteraceae bacterium]
MMKLFVGTNGQRWHLPALPTTLARLLLRSQARRKEKRLHTTNSTTPVRTCGIYNTRWIIEPLSNNLLLISTFLPYDT